MESLGQTCIWSSTWTTRPGNFRVRTGLPSAPHCHTTLGCSGIVLRTWMLSTKSSSMAAKTLLLTPGINRIVLPTSGHGQMVILASLFHQLLPGPTSPAGFNNSLGSGLKRPIFNDGSGPPTKKPKLPNKPSSQTQLQRLGGTGQTMHLTSTSRWSTSLHPKPDPLDLNFAALKANLWHQKRNLAGSKTTWLTCMLARISQALTSSSTPFPSMPQT